jgi:hypothetical protein
MPDEGKLLDLFLFIYGGAREILREELVFSKCI